MGLQKARLMILEILSKKRKCTEFARYSHSKSPGTQAGIVAIGRASWTPNYIFITHLCPTVVRLLGQLREQIRGMASVAQGTPRPWIPPTMWLLYKGFFSGSIYGSHRLGSCHPSTIGILGRSWECPSNHWHAGAEGTSQMGIRPCYKSVEVWDWLFSGLSHFHIWKLPVTREEPGERAIFRRSVPLTNHWPLLSIFGSGCWIFLLITGVLSLD